MGIWQDYFLVISAIRRLSGPKRLIIFLAHSLSYFAYFGTTVPNQLKLEILWGGFLRLRFDSLD